MRSAVLGGAVATAVCLLAGLAADGSRGAVGRFRITSSDNHAYLVDTVTGQVWRSTDRDFARPKLGDRPIAATAQEKKYVGLWQGKNSAGEDLTLRLEGGGHVYATQNTRHFEGSWQVGSARILITFGSDHLLAEMTPDGRLSLWQEGKEGERTTFQKAP